MLLGGRPNCSGVVRYGSDGTLDDILGIEGDVFVPAGAETSRWSGTGEFEKINEHWGRTEITYGNADESGIAIEVSFGNDSALLNIYTDQPHPILGNGLLLVVKLPNLVPQNEASSEANNLNFWESCAWTNARAPFLGNWCSAEVLEEQYCVAYTSFLPNLLYQPGLAENAALWGLSRVRCVRETFYPDLVDVPMYEILKERLKLSDSE